MEVIVQSPFAEIAALLVMAAVIGFLGIILRQPLIVSFIAVGLIAGPSALDLVRSDEQISLLSELGIAVLLFLVGIKLDVKLIRSLGAVSLLTGHRLRSRSRRSFARLPLGSVISPASTSPSRLTFFLDHHHREAAVETSARSTAFNGVIAPWLPFIVQDLVVVLGG